MTMAVIAVALALPLLLYLFLQNVRSATASWNEAFDLSVYMDKSANGARIEACRSRFSDQSLTLVASLVADIMPPLIWRICSPALVNWLLRNSDWICIAC